MSKLKVLTDDKARQVALELARLNIQTATEWVRPEEVIHFIEIVSEAFTKVEDN